MRRFLFAVPFLLGAIAVVWIAATFLSNPVALTVTLIIAADYTLGFAELLRFRRTTATLDQQLDDLPSLHTFQVNLDPSYEPEIQITDNAVELLSRYPQLEDLCLRYTNLTWAGVSQLATGPLGARLRTLNLDATQLSKHALRDLARMPQLKKLEIGLVDSFDTTGLVFFEGTGLEKLSLYANETVDDDSLKMVAKIENLNFLNLSRTGVTAVGLAKLSSLKLLREVEIYYVDATKEEIQALSAQMPLVLFRSEYGDYVDSKLVE